MSHTRFWLGLVLFCFALIAIFSFGNPVQPEKPQQRPLKKVTVAQVRSQPSEHIVKFPGTLRSKNRAHVAFTVGGRLENRPFKEGDHVTKGQPLAKIDQQPYLLAKAQAFSKVEEVRAQMQQAELAKTRADNLLEAKAITKAEWEQIAMRRDSLIAGMNTAKAALGEAERQLKETQLRAPFSGTITSIHLEPGEFAHPGSTVLTLSGSSGLEMEIQIPENMINQLTMGQQVRISLPMISKEAIFGAISKIGGASSGKGLFPLIIDFPNVTDLRPGYSAVANLSLKDSAAIAIPIAAVINPSATQPIVYKLIDGKVTKVQVRVAQLRERWVSISGDLNPGDQVITGGHPGLLEGDQVEVVQ